jgi:hypothetical protein
MSGKKAPLLTELRLHGLRLAPSQILGGVRIVPVVRPNPRDDLRIALRATKGMGVVKLDGEVDAPGLHYCSTYLPHALVVGYSEDGSAASYGAQLRSPTDGKMASPRRAKDDPWVVNVFHRMVKRETGDRLRLLPLHLAMEGFLALCFGGPPITWTEYSKQAIRRGLDPRIESAFGGRAVHGLDDALRLFEMHDDQVGVLLFVANALASAFVVSHPDDYRLLHRSVLEDFYAEILVHYARLYDDEIDLREDLDPARVASFADLRADLARVRGAHAAFLEHMASGILARGLDATRVTTMGPFSLQRFMTSLDLDVDNHMGEAIVREPSEGEPRTLEYLKTYRLSQAQAKRAFLLQTLAQHGWNLQTTAQTLKTTPDELVVRMCRAGWTALFKPDVVAAAYKNVPPHARR